MKSTSLFIYTETSLHAGVGSTVSVIDLPIQRERTTQYPIVQGSGIKGALRSQVESDMKSYIDLIFGGEEADLRDEKKKVNFAGSVSVGDARIVLFPVRSLAGVFAYITCPAVLARIKRDISSFPAIASVDAGCALVNKHEPSDVAISDSVVFEEFNYRSQPTESVDRIAEWLANNALPQREEYSYWRNKLLTSLAILPNNDFRDFVLNSTEIVTRVRLDSAKKTVVEGALWTQEMLPSDTLMMSNIIIRSTRSQRSLSDAGIPFSPEEVAKWLHNPEPKSSCIPDRIQLGGDETTGQGMVALRWYEGN
jgi:CRISPR-associated protein Cmr4